MKSFAMNLASIVAATATAMPVAAQYMEAQIADIRAATEKYSDVNAALADGFVPDPSGACVTAEAEGLPPELGGMGIHYLHMGRLGITTDKPRVDGNGTNVDFAQPSILLYEPQADGTLALIGVENLVFIKAWEAAGNSGAPSFAGRKWDRMADDAGTDGDEAHAFEPHFDLHVWTARENPAGPTAPFNPAVNCENAG